MSLHDDNRLPWFAVQTQPRRESAAEGTLRRLGIAVFLPRYRKRTILHGYRREVVGPLFPGYLFATFDPGECLRMVHYAHGVRAVVMFGGEPASVPVALLESIEARMQDGYVRLAPPALWAGQRVEIIDGPLAGMTGIFQANVRGAERVAILLDTLRYNARAVLDRIAVRAVA
jgi:transcriptional antiterminator RfaH